MDDGKVYKITHSHFALAAPDAIVLVSGPGHDVDASFVICRLEHLARVEVLNGSKTKGVTWAVPNRPGVFEFDGRLLGNGIEGESKEGISD